MSRESPKQGRFSVVADRTAILKLPIPSFLQSAKKSSAVILKPFIQILCTIRCAFLRMESLQHFIWKKKRLVLSGIELII